MKKFSQKITESDITIDFKAERGENYSTDIEDLRDDMEDSVDFTKLEGEWEIDSIISVSQEPPKTNESSSIIVNADIAGKDVKRGDFIYITALIHRKGNSAYHQSQMGVLKTRIVDIYNSLLILNTLK
jgi:hypothetical protein